MAKGIAIYQICYICNLIQWSCNRPVISNAHLCAIMKTVSFIIIIVGVIMIAYNRFNFISSDKIADIGNVQMVKHKSQNIQWPPIAGLALVVGGILMITIPKKDI